MESPTDAAPPPSYQMSVEEFDQKTSRAVQISSSSSTLQIDEDGWQIYNPTAFEAVAESSTQSPPASTSAGIIGVETSRIERQVRSSMVKIPPSPKHMKTKSAERNRYNTQRDDGHSAEDRVATPPPPFTPTGPSLDGPPFEEVVRLDYVESESQAASPLEPTYSPPAHSPPTHPPPPPLALQPVEPLRLPPNRRSDSHLQTSRNPHPPRRPSPILSDIYSRPSPTSTITRVEFDHRMAYSSNGTAGNHTTIQAGATAFYNHAVASQLQTSPTVSASTQQPGYNERTSPYSSAFSSTTSYRPQHTMSSISLHDQYQAQNLPFIAPGPPPPLPHQSQSTSPPPGMGFAQFSNGAGRGPLPQVPTPNVPMPHAQWGGSQVHLVQDVYGRN